MNLTENECSKVSVHFGLLWPNKLLCEDQVIRAVVSVMGRGNTSTTDNRLITDLRAEREKMDR